MNTTMSVCEIGATIGRMWRELTDVEKQKYNDEFVQAKVTDWKLILVIIYYYYIGILHT